MEIIGGAIRMEAIGRVIQTTIGMETLIGITETGTRAGIMTGTAMYGAEIITIMVILTTMYLSSLVSVRYGLTGIRGMDIHGTGVPGTDTGTTDMVMMDTAITDIMAITR
jgi:hypothetical protein